MRFKYSWLLLAAPLGSTLAEFLHHDVHGEIISTESFETDIYVQEGQQPLFSGKPHHPHGEEPLSTTIYQHLADDPRFSLVTKALNFVEDIASLLNDSSSDLTFFAPPDRVLRRPSGTPPKRNSTTLSFLEIDQMLESDVSAMLTGYNDLREALAMVDQLDSIDHVQEPDHEKRKKIIKIILRAILSYHIIPTPHDIASLGGNVTYATNLRIPGALDSQPLRLRVTQTILPPVTRINLFTRIVHPNVKATNGFIHVVDHPLIPPPSVFQQLYMVPHFFSTLTSALQRSDLTSDVDLRFVHDEGLKGASAVTLFAPTNRAFEALPKKLQLFLFSPFGARVLKKLLRYHIVPNAIVHSNYIHGEAVKPNEDQLLELLDEDGDFGIQHASPSSKKPSKHHHSKLVSSLNLTLDTLLDNHTLNAVIARKKVTFPALPGHKKPYFIDTKVFVNHQLAIVSDIVALNGAIHVVHKLLDPRPPHHGHGGDHGREHLPPHHAPERRPKCPWEHRPDHDSDRDHQDGPIPPPHHDSEDVSNGDHHASKPRHEQSHRYPFKLDHEPVHKRGWEQSHSANDDLHHHQSSLQDEDDHDVWADWEMWLPQWAEATD